MKLIHILPLHLIIMLLAPSGIGRADVFELKEGGRISGVLIEQDKAEQNKNDQYVIRTDGGALVTLDHSQVRKRVTQDDNSLEYEQRSRALPDTVEAHHELAQWCKRQGLGEMADHHLQRILQLDPNDPQARQSLGFQKHHGRWFTREQIMEQRGMHHFEGAYRTSQDIALREQQKHREQAETDWFRKIRGWRRWLDDQRSTEAAQNIAAIRDPYAANALIKLLDREDDPKVRSLYIETLGELRHPAAVQKLVSLSIYEFDHEVRQQCLDYLLRLYQPISLLPYLNALRDKDNAVVNQAAEALERIGNPAALSPLIDALATTHKYDNPESAPEEINATFTQGPNSSGGGFTFGGGGKKVISVDQRNIGARRALVELSGGQDFEFNENAWRRWFVNQQELTDVDARRDN